MPELSSGSWQRRPVSSEAGSPAKQSGGGGRPRNWRCGCQPGILGPPQSPIPPLLRSTIELTAAGPPTSWKMSHTQSHTLIDMKWKTTRDTPSKPFLLFPPALLTVMSSLNDKPSCWSLEHVDGLLSCSLSWLNGTNPPEPVSPVTPTNLNDSGYASPVQSPIPFHLTLEDDAGPQFPTSPRIQPRDAATSTESSTSCSLQTQTSSPAALIHAGTQTSPLTSKSTHDAAVTTTFPTLVSCQTQTSSATLDSGTQASIPATPPCLTKPATSTKKRRKPKSTTPKPPSTADAATSYNPPPTVIPRWCRLCSSPILPDTKPLSHLFTCDGIPHLLGAECEGLLNDWSETLGLSLDALAIMSELLLTTFDPCSTDPSTFAFTSKDFLIGKLIPRSCTASYDKYPQFWSQLTHLTTSLETECRNLLKLPSTEPLSALFSHIDPELDENTDVDDGDLAEFDPHHPFDELDNIPTDYESECYLGDEY